MNMTYPVRTWLVKQIIFEFVSWLKLATIPLQLSNIEYSTEIFVTIIKSSTEINLANSVSIK